MMNFKEFKAKLQKILAMFSEPEIDNNFDAEKEIETDDYWETIMSAEYNYDPEEVPF